MNGGGAAGPYQLGFVDEEDAGVGLEVDAVGPLDDFEALDSDVGFVGQAKTDEVEHGAGGSVGSAFCRPLCALRI